METLDLDRLFNPESIALIGASATPFKWGSIIPLNILKGNYHGRLFPVNPGRKPVLGQKCYASVLDIPETVDVALITTPAKTVPEIVEECGRKGIPYLVIISADFSETGPQGAALEAQILDLAKQTGVRIVGPNTMGIYSSKSGLHALMPPTMPQQGPISMFSQSGNVGVQMLAWGVDEGVGFNKFVSSGNEADLNSSDYMKYFAEDDDTRVILAYMEGIDPKLDFFPVAKSVSMKKPVLLFKGGRTEAGGKAASSHSGAIAASNRVFKSAMRQAGVIEVQTSQALMDCAKAFSNYPYPEGNRVAILTRGGGWGVITSDFCEESGLVVPDLPRDIIQKIDKLLPSYWSRGNPVDMVATISNDPFLECLEILADWDGIDAVVALGATRISGKFPFSPHVTEPPELMETIERILKFRENMSSKPDSILLGIDQLIDRIGKPIFAVSIGADHLHRTTLQDYHVVSYPTPERAVRVLAHMVAYSKFKQSCR